MINILISGYLGFRNSGDESILYAIQKKIKDNSSDIKITALSKRPEETKRLYNIQAVPAFHLFKVIKSIYNSDIVLSGGGTLLQDGTSSRSLWYYLLIIALARLMGKKTMLYANGIGPLNRRYNRLLVKFIVNRVQIVTLREEMSYNELQKIGVKKPIIEVAADPVFTLRGLPKEEAEELLHAEGIPTDKPLIMLAFRQWHLPEHFYTSMGIMCDVLVERYKANIVFLPMQYPQDIKVSKKIQQAMVHEKSSYLLNRQCTPDEIIGIIGLGKLVLAMRLHALLYASIKNVPMLGFVYDPKVQYYLDTLGMPSAGDLKNFDLEKGLKTVYDLMSDYDHRVEELEKVSIRLKELAKKNEHYLNEMIDEFKDVES